MDRCVFLLTALFAALLCASHLHAAPADINGPAVIKLKMGAKTLDFSHRKHQKLTNNKCWECHAKTNGKIENWSEATAHKLCIACHDLYEKGPVSCKSCHQKK